MLQKSPLIVTGQIYLHADLDEYMIVTRNKSGLVYYCGDGFKGSSDDQVFIERFQPVDPEDVCPIELQGLLNFCPEGTFAKVGYIIDEDEDQYEEEC